MSLSLVPAFPTPNGSVFAARVFGNTLYLAGSFTQVNGQPRNGFAAVDATTGALLPLAPTITGGGPVHLYDVLEFNGNIYIVGLFTTVNGQPRLNMAAFTPAGTVLPWNPDPGGLNPSAQRIRQFGGYIYLGGTFTSLKDSTVPVVRRGLAQVDSINGDPTAFNPDVTAFTPATVVDFDFDVTNGILYLGGAFTAISGQPRVNAGAVDAFSGAVLPWAPQFSGVGVPHGILFNNGTIYVSGAFVTATGLNGSFTRVSVAATDAFGNILPFNAAVTSGYPPNIRSMVVSPDQTRLFLAGGYTLLSAAPRNALGEVDPSSGALNVDFDPQILPASGLGQLFCMAVESDYIYAAGNFQTILGQAVPNFAVLQYTELLPPVPPVPPTPVPGNTLTVLKWFPVTRDENNNPISVDGYNVYRSVDPNTEELVLVATITTRDINGQVDTMFSERIDGFYRYAVAAFNSFGEGPRTSISVVPTTQPERIG